MITIIDYGVGNIGSVANTLTRLGQSYQISSDSTVVSSADVLLLPGVGAAGVGMQLLFETSEEANTICLGILKGSVKKFQLERKVPQIGWNQVIPVVTNPNAARLFAGIPEGSQFYFVNSYYPAPSDLSVSAA